MIQLGAREARIIGCLMEKSVTTPDQYPLSLNALTNACNQKSSRDPVMSLSEDEVNETLRQLMAANLVTLDANYRGRVEKYQQRMFNTPFAEVQLTEEMFAIICVLLLRGPATPGELKTRCQRLHPFADNAEVTGVLQSMIDREEGAIIARLPRTPGRQDHEYAQLFTGAVVTVAPPQQAAPARSETSRIDALEARIEALEAALSRLEDAQR